MQKWEPSFPAELTRLKAAVMPHSPGPFMGLLKSSFTHRDMGNGWVDRLAPGQNLRELLPAGPWLTLRPVQESSLSPQCWITRSSLTVSENWATAACSGSSPAPQQIQFNTPTLPTAREGQAHSRLLHTWVTTPGRNPLQYPAVKPRKVLYSSFVFWEGGCVSTLR